MTQPALKRLMVLTAAVALGGTPLTADTITERAREQRKAFAEAAMTQIAGEEVVCPLTYAFAALYTQQNVKRANAELRSYLAELAGPDDDFLEQLGRPPTVNKRGNEEIREIKWRMRGWVRVYYLFNDRSAFFPGRLETDVQAKLEEMFYAFGYYKSSLWGADLKNIWHIDDSENHDIMGKSNAYLALQAVHKLKAYKDRELKDGNTPSEHVQAWHKYFALYPLERAKNGLYAEMSPGYGKWFLGEIVNMYEFSDSQRVRLGMEKLLHLTWADWSVDQLHGVRGGGMTRSKPGPYCQLGESDSWSRMASDLMGINPWYWNSHGSLSTLVLQTSRYKVPDLILEVALNKGEYAPFVYQSTRPGRGRAVPHPLKKPYPYYDLDSKAGGILRYSYCTPGAIMGSWMVDTQSEYVGISTENRWQGVLFSSSGDSRIYPQSVPTTPRVSTHQQHMAVQHRNAMLVANHPKARITGELRVFIAEHLHGKLKEEDGWAIVNDAKTWLAFRPLNDGGFDLRKVQDEYFKKVSGREIKGYWLLPRAKGATIVFVLSRESKHKTLQDFLAYLKNHKYGIDKGIAHYAFKDDLGEETRLELGKSMNIPHINGKPVNLYPKKVFDSPYLSSDHGSGVVTISKGDKKLVLDFNER